MNETDPIRYCFHGQHKALRNTFRFLPGYDSQRRRKEVCGECYARIVAMRAEAAKRAKEIA